jgi:hypothetical protein
MSEEVFQLGPRKSMEAAIVDYLDEQYSPVWQAHPSTLPTGLRLELHPFTRMKLLRDPDFDRARAAEPGIFDKVHIPVEINMDLQPGEWQLVVVVKDVKIGGRLP